jgi:Transposase DDE domain
MITSYDIVNLSLEVSGLIKSLQCIHAVEGLVVAKLVWPERPWAGEATGAGLDVPALHQPGAKRRRARPQHGLAVFRNTLTKQGLLDTLLLEVNRQLSAKGLYIKTGEVSIVDATVIEAKQSRPRKSKDGEDTQDSEAGYNVKVAANGKKTSTYGYKAHVNVDEDGFIKAVDYTPGNEHDSHSLKKLLTTTEEQVYADKAYASAGHDRLLAKRNTGNRILHLCPVGTRPSATSR